MDEKTRDLASVLLGLIVEAGNRDSLTFGTPGKMGEVKVYLDFSDLEECRKRIDNALKARNYAQGIVEEASSVV